MGFLLVGEPFLPTIVVADLVVVVVVAAMVIGL
jgi:hypothetical protein